MAIIPIYSWNKNVNNFGDPAFYDELTTFIYRVVWFNGMLLLNATKAGGTWKLHHE